MYGRSAFSPNGRFLAAFLVRDQKANPSAQGLAPHALGIIDLRTQKVRIPTGSGLAGGYNYVTWTADGRTVIFTGGSEHREIVTYRPGKRSAERLPLRVGDFYGIAAD